MTKYKWIALSNTTLGALMASINSTIILISLPAVFNGLGIDPLQPEEFVYMLWIIMGYMVVSATLLVTLGRISDIFGRVRLYNMGFAIFTIGSILLYLTPSSGNTGALELIIFRLVQAVGGGFLLANSSAILTDAFPHNERGKALGINSVFFLTGSLIGLILGGVLVVYGWRNIFLVSIPFGLVGTVWAYLKLREIATIRKEQKLDITGNLLFAVGLTLLLVAVTYGLVPYGNSSMGWSSPFVMGGVSIGILMLLAFVLFERKAEDPMFRLELFKIRSFAAGNLSGFVAAIARGGLMFMLIIWLQGIWLPLHGFSYESTPFWSGIYMIPFTAGFLVMGIFSGMLSDRYGPKRFATIGLLITFFGFIALAQLPYDFSYPVFGTILFGIGFGMGLFSSPNASSIMNSVPSESRGAASGMMMTLLNTGQLTSLAVFFAIVVSGLSSGLSASFYSSLTNAGIPANLASTIANLPPTAALFAAFLGYNPLGVLIPHSVLNSLPTKTVHTVLGESFFPNAIAPSFMSSLAIAFYISAAISVFAAIISWQRGETFIYEVHVQQSPSVSLKPSQEQESKKLVGTAKEPFGMEQA